MSISSTVRKFVLDTIRYFTSSLDYNGKKLQEPLSNNSRQIDKYNSCDKLNDECKLLKMAQCFPFIHPDKTSKIIKRDKNNFIDINRFST